MNLNYTPTSPDTITWTMTAPFTYMVDPNNSSNVTVYKTGWNTSVGTLKAFVNGTEVASKTITPCDAIVGSNYGNL